MASFVTAISVVGGLHICTAFDTSSGVIISDWRTQSVAAMKPAQLKESATSAISEVLRKDGRLILEDPAGVLAGFLPTEQIEECAFLSLDDRDSGLGRAYQNIGLDLLFSLSQSGIRTENAAGQILFGKGSALKANEVVSNTATGSNAMNISFDSSGRRVYEFSAGIKTTNRPLIMCLIALRHGLSNTADLAEHMAGLLMPDEDAYVPSGLRAIMERDL